MYRNRGEKAHKTEQSGAQKNQRKKDRAIANRSGTISRSMGRKFQDQDYKAE